MSRGVSGTKAEQRKENYFMKRSRRSKEKNWYFTLQKATNETDTERGSRTPQSVAASNTPLPPPSLSAGIQLPAPLVSAVKYEEEEGTD